MKMYIFCYVLLVITACRTKAIAEDYIDFGTITCTTTGEMCPINATCEFACNFSCSDFYNEPGIFGTGIYSSESSICKSALHDLRISIWNPSARKVIIKSYEKESCFLASSVRFGFHSQPVQINGSCSVFEFISPRISEKISDVVSMHRNYLFKESGSHTQFCFAASDDHDEILKFGIYSNWRNLANYDTINVAKDFIREKKVWTQLVAGGFQCIPSNTTLSVITSIAFRKSSCFYPSKLTITVNKNENITLKMYETEKYKSMINTVWKKDGRILKMDSKQLRNDQDRRTEVTLTNVQESHSGFYSLEYDFPEQKIDGVGIVQLIVRSCPSGRYGTNCSMECPTCLNKGVCHDITGECICAPGFNGSSCEKACHPSYVGKMCNIKCPAEKSQNLLAQDACQGLLICLPHPYGCSCAFGFKGINCDKDYPVLKSVPVLLDVSKTDCTLQFSEWIKFKDAGAGVPVAYDVVYKQFGALSWTLAARASHPCPNSSCRVKVRNLMPATRYEVAVLVVDEYGHKEESDVQILTVRTLCNRPLSPPAYIQIFSLNQTIYITWELPPRGTWNCWKLYSIVKFRDIRYNYLNESITEDTEFSFSSDAYITWIVQVCVLSYSKQYEKCSDYKTITADGPALSEAVDIEVIPGENSVSLSWLAPPEFSGRIFYYAIGYEDIKTGLFQIRRFPVEETKCAEKNKQNYNCYLLGNLVAHHDYRIEITAYMKNDRKGIQFNSFFVKVLGTNYLPIIFAIFLPLILAVILGLILFYMNRGRKLKNPSKVRFLPHGVENEFATCNDALDELDIVELESLCEELINPIRVEDLTEFVKNNVQNNKIKKEFTTVPTGQIYPCYTAKLFENKQKNRYGNILPYDHSRVILNTVKGDPSSHYIHASYIQGYENPRKYIATQGPLLSTLNDFWRMVWIEGSCKILMITNFVENGRPKCEKYWTETSCQYGDIMVTFQNSKSYAEFVIRTFTISKNQSKGTREVKQFHFTTWPDHSAPPCTTPFLIFLNKARSYKPDLDAPIIVHCSAGIGRTGTTILIDSMIDMGLYEKKVDVVNHLCSMRKQRMNIVENLEQYIFIYNALADKFCIKDTRIKCSEFKKKFEKLQTVDNATGLTLIEKQFQVLNQSPENPKKDVVSAYHSENQWKNRSMLILPSDRARPRLSSVYSSFYINAVFVDSYTKKDACIVTQYPLLDTLKDFWNMIYEVQSETVVILQDIDTSDQEIPVLWQPEDAQVFDRIQIECESISVEDDIQIARILITPIDEKEIKVPLSVNVLFFQKWKMDSKVPLQLAPFLSLLSKVQSLQEIKSHVITAVCFDGAVACGIFCAILYICDQIKTEKIVDVFRAAKSIRSNRNQFIVEAAQYNLLYDLVLAYLTSLLK